MSSKRVKITPDIEAKIKASVGDPELDTSKLVVYEARTLSTEPIKKRGTFYENARFTKSTLLEMADLISTPGKGIPLQVMHETNLLPVGKIFSGEVFDKGNFSELHTLFYIPNDKVNFINDIDNAIIDEVSVGVMAKKALCSKCGFDYFSEKATFGNLFTLTCDNDHTIGTDGVHVVCDGLRDFAEVSLVNRGAAKDAKILSRAKQAMGQDTVDRLAASGVPLDARLVTVNNKLEASTSKQTLIKGDLSMDKETLALIQAKADEVANTKVQLTEANTKVDGLNKTVTELQAKLSAKDTEIEALKAASTKGAELADKVEKSETQMKEAFAKLLPHAKATLSAFGVTDANLPTDLISLMSLIEEKGIKLHQIFTPEGKSANDKDGLKADDKANDRLGAFKTLKLNK